MSRPNDDQLRERLTTAIGANVDALRYITADDLIPVVRAYAAEQLREAANVLGKHLADNADGWLHGDALTVVRELNLRAYELEGEA